MNHGRIVRLLIPCVASLLCGAVLAADPDEERGPGPWIDLSRAEFEDGRVSVDFRVEEVFTQESLELIHSGIPVKFRHRIELVGPRKFMLSPRNVLARTVIETRVSFDALTGRYELSRVTTLKKPSRKKGPPPYVEGTVTNDPDEMQRWMAEGQHVVLYDPKRDLEVEGKELRVAIESSVGRRYVMWVIPTRQSVKTIGPVSR